MDQALRLLIRAPSMVGVLSRVELNRARLHLSCIDADKLHAFEAAVVDGVRVLGCPDSGGGQTEVLEHARDCRNDFFSTFDGTAWNLPEASAIEVAVSFLLGGMKQQVFDP